MSTTIAGPEQQDTLPVCQELPRRAKNPVFYVTQCRPHRPQIASSILQSISLAFLGLDDLVRWLVP